MTSLTYYFSPTGAVICQNRNGLIFFLQGEAPSRFATPQPVERSDQAGPQRTGLMTR